MRASRLDASERGPAVTRVRRAAAHLLDAGALRRGERAVVGCSGGPDSTVLVDVLSRLAPPRELRLHVVHVDHGLRPGGAEEAALVAALAAGRGLPFTAVAVAVGAGPNLQDRARRARHVALRAVAEEHGATAVALGHTADDQAETVLMRALRGATPGSLRAMSPRDGGIARPLLGVWRSEVTAYCAERGLEALDDPSNHDPRFLRTRLRTEVFPALEAVFPGARRRLCTLAERTRVAGREGGRAPFEAEVAAALSRDGA